MFWSPGSSIFLWNDNDDAVIFEVPCLLPSSPVKLSFSVSVARPMGYCSRLLILSPLFTFCSHVQALDTFPFMKYGPKSTDHLKSRTLKESHDRSPYITRPCIRFFIANVHHCRGPVDDPTPILHASHQVRF